MADEFDDLDDFGFDQLDESTIQCLDQIEQQANTSTHAQNSTNAPHSAGLSSLSVSKEHQRQPSSADDDFDDEFDESFLRGIDEIDSQLSAPNQQKSGSATSSGDLKASSGHPTLQFAPQRKDAVPKINSRAQAASPIRSSTGKGGIGLARTLSRTSSRGGIPSNSASSGHVQMNLFGEAIPSTSSSRLASQGPGHFSSQTITHPSDSRLRQASTKQWDRTAYAKSGSLSKGKGTARDRDEFGAPIDLNSQDGGSDVQDDWDKESSWKSKALPPPKAAPLPKVLPMKHEVDREAAQTWIYPTNLTRRDYQYNIVQRALFHNVLVALPTGLGKTFIAAVVILNFFRWYPTGKIVFLAPTRPLVDQQKMACHGICGLPWDTAIDLTGSTTSKLRSSHWETKRIFYMTPQTFENDLQSGNCDPRDIVCLVVDEAHRATGKYAYGNVVSHLMMSNPHFRVLALSATPGSSSEKVQEVIDRLHISHIEIRTEEALDIRKYVHRKHEDIVRVALGKDLNGIKDNWAKLMRTYMDPLVANGLLYQKDPAFLHPFAVRSLSGDKRYFHVLKERPFLRSMISELHHMTLSMMYLVEHSITMFYDRLQELSSGSNAKGKKPGTKRQQMFATSNTTFREIIKELELLQDDMGKMIHPKMTHLKDVVLEHFTQNEIARLHAQDAVEHSGMGVDGRPPSGTQYQTRVMVFCSFRECVNEIVHYLKRAGLKATSFVGQAKDKNGNKGMTQKEQEKVIQQFKDGTFNVLVATSIGEEGLDIGEVDLIVCYEAVKDSVRMLQRIGRTGRKRDGKIIVLMSEGREEQNWRTSKDSYKAVQKDINSGLFVELYDDVDRMIPSDINPKPDLQAVEQPKFDPSMVSDGKRPARSTATKKRKRDSNPARNVPEESLMGFLKASDLAKRKRRKGKGILDDDSSDSDAPATGKRRTQMLELSDTEDSDDSLLKRDFDFSKKGKGKQTDKVAPTPAVDLAKSGSSSVPKSQIKAERKDQIRQTSSLSPAGQSGGLGSPASIPAKRKRLGTRTSGSVPTASKLGAGPSQEKSNSQRSAGSNSHIARQFKAKRSSAPLAAAKKEEHLDDDLDLPSLMLDSDVERQIGNITQAAGLSAEVTNVPLDTNDSSLKLELSPPSPTPLVKRRKPHPLIAEAVADEGIVMLDTDEEDGPVSSSSPVRKTARARKQATLVESDDEADGKRTRGAAKAVKSSKTAPAPRIPSSSPQSPPQQKVKQTMGPPDSVPRRADTSAADTQQSPVVERLSRLRRGRKVEESPEAGPSRPAGRKNVRDEPKTSKRKKRIGGSPTSRALFMHEADRSTDEEVHGERDEHDEGIGSDEEDDDDRAAVGMFEPTQAPRGYNQQQIYMRSLMTQNEPSPFKKNRGNRAPFPGIGGRFGIQETPPARRTGPVIPSSESRRAAQDSDDHYSMDSFCVNDDDEILYDNSQSDGLPERSSQL